jgi:hypothetical protein
VSQNRELREDGSFELREDGGLELREGEADFDDDIVRRRVSLPPRSGRARGLEFAILVEFFPGMARGDARAPGIVIEDFAGRHGHAAGTEIDMTLGFSAGGPRGAIVYDRAIVNADFLAVASL